MTPEPAQGCNSYLPGALSSPRTPEESEEFWRDLGRSPDAYPLLCGALFGLQQGCVQPQGGEDG